MFNSGNCASVPLVASIDGCGGNGNNNGNGMWGENGLLFIIVLALLFGWGNNGWGNGGNGGGNAQFVPYQVGSTYTDAAIQRGFDNQSVMNKLNGIEQGICSLGYDQLNQMNGINQNISHTGFAIQQAINADTVAGMQNTNAIQSTLCNMAAQNQQCCCETQRLLERGFADTNYNMATQACDTRNTIQNTTRDIIDNQNAGTRAILDFLTNDKIATLQAENQSLKFAASQSEQNAFIAANQTAQTAELIRRLGADCPVNAVVVQPNTPVTFPTNCCGQFNGYGYGNGYNNGCGCNSGCGCA